MTELDEMDSQLMSDQPVPRGTKGVVSGFGFTATEPVRSQG